MSKFLRKGFFVLLALCVAVLCAVPALADEAEGLISLPSDELVIDLAVSSNGGRLSPAVSASVTNPRFSYSTSDSSVARVSSSGTVTGRKVGTCTVTAALRGTNETASRTVIVKDSRIPESISFAEGSTLTMERYETRTLTPAVAPSSADQRVRWKSSNSSVVYVSSKGVLTAKKGGTATITCYSYRSKAVCAVLNVTVNQYPSPTALSIDPDTSYMVTGTTMQLTPVTQPAGVQVCSFFTWKSSSSRIATVTADGLVTAKKTGYVTITCTSRQNTRIRATRKILVVAPDSPYYIRLNTSADTLTLNPTDTLSLSSSVYPADRAQGVRWSSSRSSVVSIDQNGHLTAKKAGTAVITATSSVNRLVKTTLTIKVVNLPAPDSISLGVSPSTIEKGDTLQLTPSTYPLGEKRSQEFGWKTSSRSIASVSSSGLVTARRTGTVTITCYSKANSRIKTSVTFKVIDSKMPDSISLNLKGDLSMEDGQTITLVPTVLPSTAVQSVTWKSSRTSVATVSNGVVTARGSGTAYITATSTYSSSRSVRIKVVVSKKAAPAALSLSAAEKAIYVGKTSQLTVVPSPANASVLCSFSSSDPSIASVDEKGLITTYRTGVVIVTAKSLKNAAATSSLVIAVYDENTPGAVQLSAESLYLGKYYGDQLSASVYPATAPQDICWSSSNDGIVSVDSTGYVKANAIGTAVVTASASNGVTAQCVVSVTMTQVSSVIPARVTGMEGIQANLEKIYAIEDSALDVIAMLKLTGEISDYEAASRTAIIKRAFSMQAFPWMTLKTQEYWTSKYAEKRYLPGIVYYGLPYTQKGKSGNTANRTYNADKAVSENRYYDSGNGYYILNQNRLLDSSYVGCDCSSFVNMATFGLNHPASQLKTYTMNVSSYYKTLRSYSELRPGDHVVLGKSHTVMFLYWMNAEKTRFMIIEQGGDGSTVICSIKEASYYSSQGYIPRRVASFS